MSICSIHQDYRTDCRLCNTDIREILPDYDRMIAEAEAAGKTTCTCGFVYYNTTDHCPLCNKQRPDPCK